jgi:hypothetical protein
VIIILEIGLREIEYPDLHVLEQTFKSFIYSVKLKLEFSILSKLVGFFRGPFRRQSCVVGPMWYLPWLRF